jgi:hypothetical protein
MSYDPKKHADVSVVTEGPDDRQVASCLPGIQREQHQRHVSRAESPLPYNPMDRVSEELLLLEIGIRGPVWAEAKGGWNNCTTGQFITLDAAREAVEARIVELGLSRERIDDHLNSPGESMAEYQRWNRQDFATRMARFQQGAANENS